MQGLPRFAWMAACYNAFLRLHSCKLLGVVAVSCVKLWFSISAGNGIEGCFSEYLFLGELWKSLRHLLAVHLTFSFCSSNQWMLLERKEIWLTVPHHVLHVGQLSDAGEGRCVLENPGCRRGEQEIILSRVKCSLKSSFWYRARMFIDPLENALLLWRKIKHLS